jgi:hypothetical protein
MNVIHPHQALQTIRRLSREVEDLTERFTATASKRALADLNGVRLSLARVQKSVQTDVNARKKLRELHAAQLAALKAGERG